MRASEFEMFFGLFALVWLPLMALWIWALVDAVRVPDDSLYQSGDKLLWVLVIVLTGLIGAVIYLVIGRPKGGGNHPPEGTPAHTPLASTSVPPSPEGTAAPPRPPSGSGALPPPP